MRYQELLALPRLSVVSAEPDGELDRIARTITGSVRASGRAALEALLDGLIAAAGQGATVAPKTLDLLGHSTAGAALLRLGDWVLDAGCAGVRRWGAELAGRGVLPRIGIGAVRLLGCRTADTGPGRATICALAELLGVEVYGATQLLHAGHYGARGLLDAWQFMLVGSSELAAARGPRPAAVVAAAAHPRRLELAALPALPLAPHAAGWPRRIAAAETTREILSLVRGDAGAPLPGPIGAPICELALASATAGAYHLAEVLLDGAFLRFFPDGAGEIGVAYPIDDPGRLRQLLALPRPGITR